MVIKEEDVKRKAEREKKQKKQKTQMNERMMAKNWDMWSPLFRINIISLQVKHVSPKKERKTCEGINTYKFFRKVTLTEELLEALKQKSG